jgi:hypothetical protein
MKRNRILIIALVAVGLITVAGAAQQVRRDADTPFFDPVLSVRVGGFCLPNDADGKSLLGYYQKLAKTELGPFPTRIDAATDTPYQLAEPPLWNNLGRLSFEVTTAIPQAQRYFDQGLRLAFAFNHAESRRAFRQAQKLDPGCALCYWGEALVLGPNINAPMEPDAAAPALAAVSQAQALAGRASEKEQALIAALSRRYSDDPQVQRAALDGAYADAMGKVAANFPGDENIQALYAEALMDLSPWDYWEAGGTKPKGRTAEILAVLEKVLAGNPDHPGAIHFYIHMVEASARPERAEPYARRLGSAMPGAGHLVHMPFHIFFRLGLYQDALAANRAAVAADEAYIAQTASEGLYPRAYYPHNVHSLMVSAQMAGDGKSAIAAADKLARVVSDEAVRAIPWVQPIKVAPYFAHAQFSSPEAILALPDPGDGLPYAKAMWHYARGVAFAGKGEVQAARQEAERIARLGAEADFSGLLAGGVPAPDVLDLARHVVQGRIAQARGDWQLAQAEFEQAVALDDKLAYSEPPYWYYPVRQTLGAVLLQAGKPMDAEAVFRASLARVPNNGWALFGLSQTYKKLGDRRAAAGVDKLLKEAWAGDRKTLDLARL